MERGGESLPNSPNKWPGLRTQAFLFWRYGTNRERLVAMFQRTDGSLEHGWSFGLQF